MRENGQGRSFRTGERERRAASPRMGATPAPIGRRTEPRQQLVLQLPLRTGLGVEDFFVSDSNAAAVELVDRWPDWPAPAAIVTGPEGSGKTHLAHIWRARSGASLCAAAALCDPAALDVNDPKSWVIEDLDRGIGDERALFHLLNLTRENGSFLLFTSRAAPGDIIVRLPDLRSRLRALPVMEIGAPDDALLAAVLLKLFADRQITVPPPVAAYLLRRAPRSMAAAVRLVSLLDEMSLALRRPVTRPLAAEALARLERASTLAEDESVGEVQPNLKSTPKPPRG